MSIKVCLFVRVSSSRQNYKRQIHELKKFSQEKGWVITDVIGETISGKKKNEERKVLQLLLEKANKKEFEKVLVSEFSRLGRNVRELRKIIDCLHDNRISVVFFNLGGMESLENGKETIVTNIILAVYAAFAQEESERKSERIKSGLVVARMNGVELGRPKGIKEKEEVLKEYKAVIKDLEKGISLRKCMKIHSLSKGTIVKVKKLME